MSMPSEDAPQQAVMLVMVCGWRPSKRLFLRGLARVLFPVVHLLQELLRLLLVDERQPSQALLEFKRVEKDAVLVVVPRLKDLLVPYHAAIPSLYRVSLFAPSGQQKKKEVEERLTEISTIFSQ